jgi:hypothetical protein
MDSIPSAYCIFCNQNQTLEYMTRVPGNVSSSRKPMVAYFCSHKGSCAARVHASHHGYYHSMGCAYCNGKPMGMFDTLTMSETLELETHLNGWVVDINAIIRFASEAKKTKTNAAARHYWRTVELRQVALWQDLRLIAIDLRNRAV